RQRDHPDRWADVCATLPLAVGITRCWYESSMGIDSKNMVQSPRYAASSARPGSVPGRVLG
ncbi:hypothetical protein ACMWQW_32145, partial [Escherichia coli]